MSLDPAAEAERQRVVEEYQRRRREVPPDLYAAWQPAEMLMRVSRRRAAAELLHQAGVFPNPGDPCLEVGFGVLGWLAQLIDWGVPEADLHGIDLDPARVEAARRLLPVADLRVGDGGALPWPSDTFQLVIASTTFTSILDPAIRRRVAIDIERVLRPGGALLWYDFAFNNPRNPGVKRVTRRELGALFPTLTGAVRSVTLAPPLARVVAPVSWTLATLLEGLPWLRTHLLAVLVKPR